MGTLFFGFHDNSDKIFSPKILYCQSVARKLLALNTDFGGEGMCNYTRRIVILIKVYSKKQTRQVKR